MSFSQYWYPSYFGVMGFPGWVALLPWMSRQAAGQTSPGSGSHAQALFRWLMDRQNLKVGRGMQSGLWDPITERVKND